MSDGDSKNDEVDAGAQQVDAQQATIAEGVQRDLPPAPSPSAAKVDETVAVTIRVEREPGPMYATAMAHSFEYSLTISPQSRNRPVLVPGMDQSSLPRRENPEAEPARTAAIALSGDELPVAVALGLPSSTHLSPVPAREADGLEPQQETAKACAEDQIAALRSRVEELAKRVGNLESASAAGDVDPPTSRAGQLSAGEIVLSFELDAEEAAGTNKKKKRKKKATFAMETRELAKSMWESTLFVFRPDLEMGRVVTLWALVVLLLNTLLQTTIAVIVVLKMGDPKLTARMIEYLWYSLEPSFAAIYACNLLAGAWFDRLASLVFILTMETSWL